MQSETKFIYLCGPTVYDKVHIGNMRPIVTFDLIVRGYKQLNNNVKFIHNITDIDDKIIDKAIETNTTEKEISNKYSKFYIDALNIFNITTIDYLPKVTENINEIKNFITKLINNKYAYSKDNSIYFDVNKYDEYGKISNNKLDKLVSKEDNFNKNNSWDFSLWKQTDRGINWEYQHGKGRPGWHTECAFFVEKYTNGKPLIIHGGGIDLKFPHHENENAQFWASNNNDIANKWIHIGQVNLNNKKMSKSSMNLIYVDDFVKDYDSEIFASDLFRLTILSSSYNAIIDWNEEIRNSMTKKYENIQKVIFFVLLNSIKIEQNESIIKDISQLLINVKFSDVFKLINQKLKSFNSNKDINVAVELFQILELLGFKITTIKLDQEIKNIYKEWQKYLLEKNYTKADELRNILMDKKII